MNVYEVYEKRSGRRFATVIADDEVVAMILILNNRGWCRSLRNMFMHYELKQVNEPKILGYH